MTTTPAFIVKQATAAKTGPRSGGDIGYQVLTNETRTELLLMIVSNAGGGYFSSELVPLVKVLDCLKGIKPMQPFPAKTFKSAFKGKSANNPGFMAAILRAEGLLKPAPENIAQHIQAGDWKAWGEQLLAQEGTPYVPPPAKAAGAAANADITNSETPKPDSSRGKRKVKAPAEKQHPSTEDGAHENSAASD